MPGNLRTSTALYWYLQNLEHHKSNIIEYDGVYLILLFVLFFLFLRIQNYLAFILYIS